MSKQQKYPKVVIVVLIYNGMKWIDSCLGSILEKTQYPNFELICVDNKSTDESCSHIQSKYPDVHLIKNKKNYATAEGNNIGMRYALDQGADYITLMNQDIKVSENWLTEMIDLAESNKSVGIISPIQYDYEEKNLDAVTLSILHAANHHVNEGNYKEHKYYEVPEVVAASALLRQEMLLKIGLFDPLYFMYFEETEMCRKAIQNGYKVIVASGSKVFHKHMAVTTGTINERIKFLKKRNAAIYRLKDHSHSFFYNFKKVFLWSGGLKNYAAQYNPSRLTSFKVFWAVIFLMPVIYLKYINEAKRACYL